ncbi:hypothetical protein [Comamonas sp. JC664]|uniref:hypothetical protein n=1 Tax=Comamonas sp. JC664 TaxID=2801917 RepID=UPI00174E5E72|nr:hypothetical protein [Comamonas sp. JC664]MBL0694631.1 hypothetical protein [Comamonas sp. JC664]GHG96376.1 hypothetical protein GCM10012319_60780 [Comamonas sp. KCTC 72670]
MSPAFTNFLFEAVNFLVLAAVLGWLLFKPIRRALDAEQARHAQEAEAARHQREEAEAVSRAARAEREAAGRESEERRRALLASARDEALQAAEAAKRVQVEDRRRLEKELQDWRDASAAELVDTIGRIAAESVRRLLAALDGPALDLALVRAACAELASVPAEARAPASVESARPLDARARGLLEEVLGAGVRERVVTALGAGVRVTTPAGQVDATALSVARQAARAVNPPRDASGASLEGADA